MFTLSNEVMNLILHARKSLEELIKYHNGGLWGNGLAGYCGIASRFLINLAKRNHIYGFELVCGTFDGMTHCWVQYNNYCIDLTISQFEGFENKAYRVCLINSDFYRSHYNPDMIGSSAVRYQKLWEHGQSYESFASILWRFHRKNYAREFYGTR